MINTSDMYKITSCTCSREKVPSYYYCEQQVHSKNSTQPNSLIMNDVYSLADQINTLTDNITSFSIVSTRTRLYNQLQQWRDKSIDIIKNLYKQKQSELNAKICRLDAAVNQIKTEKQREISQIKMKITELINVGQAATEQVNSLRKLVDQAAFDVDKLRSSGIRIETQPANIDTCRIIYMDPAPHITSEDSTASTYRIGNNNKVRNHNKTTNRFRSTTNKSKSTMHKNRPVPPISLGSLLRKSHPPQVPNSPPTLLPHIAMPPHIPMPPPIHEPHPISKASHIPMPPPIPEPCPTSRASYIPMPPSIPEPSTTSKASHIPIPPSIPEPPPTSRASYIPMPSTIPELSSKSISSRIPMSRSMPELPPIFNSSHIPIAPDISKLLAISKPPEILVPPPLRKPSTIFKPPDILIPPPMHKPSPISVSPPLPQANLNKIRKKIRFIID